MPDAQTQVHIADTIGEMGFWHQLAPVSFIGHSTRWQLPVPRRIVDAETVAEVVLRLFGNRDERDCMTTAAQGIIDAQRDVPEQTWAAIGSVLPPNPPVQ